ncbi:unnamed protein product [Clonostachys rosea]|uniref:Uncharacterized protein n=1 Tax=Bionectria ochroleuca TaxID=29856 RepID=A0ABY6UXV3_BIOOC|nr:unnamed protein product [Clonostachys rosea]
MAPEEAPGEARFSAYNAPSLDGGLHNISVGQSISAPVEAGSVRKTPSESFIVVAPRFSLASGVIDAVHPTPGISVEHTILPHIVFTDPDLPWSRSPSPAHVPKDEDKENLRSRNTWLALLVFSQDELQLNESQINNIFQNMPPEIKRKQSETCTLRTLARHTPLLNGIENLVSTTGFKETEDANDAAEPTELIIIPGELFNNLFVAPGGPRDRLDVACYKHMAHVRQVATDGMANSGTDSDEATFSVVVSRRTGPIDADTPSMMIAHLVSLSWDDEMPFPKDEDRVAVVSLHRWTYTCLPSKNKASTFDMLPNLGSQLTVIRTDDVRREAPVPSEGGVKDMQALIAARQRDGYTLTRYHTVTGEATAALLRGALTPSQVPRPLKNNMLMLSNFGTDLAIFDPNLGLMDITYSSAWQLGKTLAMADQPFCSALARHRSAVDGGSTSAAKRDVHALFGDDGHGTRQRAAGRMVDLLKGLNGMNTSLHNHGGDATKDEGKDAGESMYNEHNTPVSPDLALIYSWVLDRVHLGDVPPQYLIPDPALLPEETLRFFHIDANWIDALIDGALSLANHWGDTPEKDLSRVLIKEAINQRLRTADKSLGGLHSQMPRYGFLLRSQLLVQFPDLTVNVKFSDKCSQPILVRKRIAPDTMYLLFDAAPSDLQRITLTLPPHQQCFRIGHSLTADNLQLILRKNETTQERLPDQKPGEGLGSRVFNSDSTPIAIFNWQTRTLDPTAFAQYLVNELSAGMKGEFDDKEPRSDVIALQLNDGVLQLDIGDANAQTTRAPISLFQLSIPSKATAMESLVPLTARSLVTPDFTARQRGDSPLCDAVVAEDRQLQKNGVSLSPVPDRLVASPLGFSLKIHTVDSTSREFVPSNTGLPVDLVFSLTRPIKDRWPKRLTRILVAVPFGDMPEDDNNPEVDIPLLARDAEPAPIMLSNMRFNVRRRRGDDDDKQLRGKIVFELVPREKLGMLVDTIKDASFQVSKAKIAQYAGMKERTSYAKVFYEFQEEDGESKRETSWYDTGAVVLKGDGSI